MSKRRVLILDDDADIRQMMTAMLSIKGYEVCAVDSVSALFEEIQTFRPAIIFTDLHINGEDGREVCKKLKASEAYAHITIVMTTGDSMAKESCLHSGADYFLEKPFAMSKLLEIVEA